MPAEIHPATAAMLRNFRYDHLPQHLQEVSKPFHDLAQRLAETLSGPEVTKALDDLWKSKNWAVLAASNADREGTPAPVIPAIGDRVLYRLTGGDVAHINPWRADFHRNGAAESRLGFVGHIGNAVQEGDVFPAIVVRVFDEGTATCNLKVLLDGSDTYWATSRAEGDDPGRWSRKGGA
ncbi:hypothetical protein [Streptomyces europaeiscabiei]|uniref:hypothetical protein n=1 Tax=Streptomyces europaeiscabiei TaxID=146819 RepID=UPI000B2F82F7|nr:hypothetical protein [Streptomyces europaeiscabiei]MDX3831403.1 hypothetical protein [Streptomyces europaeiscabiei]